MTEPDQDPIALGLSEALAGTYRVEGELARGAMAQIFVARDLRHDRTVAVKVLPIDLATPDSAERFLHEIRITADLQHPNILPLLDSGASAELSWYVMPLVEGMSLRQRVAEGPLAVREALRIAIGVAQALDYAHQRGVIHRDIKPENVLFTGGQPVVADFGLARAVGGRHRVGTPATGLPLGTPAYMSPEQATGSSEIDFRTDYYALGCVLYEMLTGQPPFAGSVTEVIHQHVEAAPGLPSALRPGLSPMVDQIVERLLAKNPEDRYQKAGELVRDLERALARETLEPSEETLEESPVEVPAAARRRLWPFLLAPAVLAAAVIVLILAPWAGGGSTAVAVLPLEGDDTDPVARFLTAEFADDLVAELRTRVGSRIEVRSASSAAAFAGLGLAPRSVGDSLDVGYLFQGEVRPAEGRVRVELRLIDTGRDVQAWAQTWDVTAGDAPRRRHEIVEAAAAAFDSVAGNR